jgi:hypothetical protein
MARGGRDQFRQALVAGAECVDSNHSQVITIYNIIWLVVWNMIFFRILGRIIPTDELIFFAGVETTNQLYVGFK